MLDMVMPDEMPKLTAEDYLGEENDISMNEDDLSAIEADDRSIQYYYYYSKYYVKGTTTYQKI